MRHYETHISRFLRSSTRPKREWSALLDLVPSGFDLLSTKQVAHQALEMMSNAANSKRYTCVLSSTQATLRSTRIPILVEDNRRERPLVPYSDLKRTQRRWLGQVILQLYFAQLFQSDTAVIDLWPSRLGVDAAGDAIWNPRPVYIRWDTRFVAALRDVYAGFFLDDESRFEDGLSRLGLGSAGGLLLRHLGQGNQRGVRFSAAHLQSTLRELSDLRLGQPGSLHRNFVAFGLYLASLHEVLESLECTLDVRSAFMRSYRQD
ncbi:MAG: hypothetical protein KJN97_14545 [Deltaproteobacteria bacterium]|nr:hypothetical protein [Deltaproteobacteria bacterium]